MNDTTPDAARNAADNEPDGFEAARRQVLEAMLDRAPFEGWTRPALEGAAQEAGVSRAELSAAFPRGVADSLRYWTEMTDAAMLEAMRAPEFSAMRIREKVAFALRARFNYMRPDREAARRAAATLALPVYGGLGARLAWKTADAVWRGLGDKSTDFNFYSKRAILTGVWTSTLARWLADDEPGEAATNAFLDARIENIMQFEKLKGRLRKAGFDPSGPLGWLAKRRYPDRPPAPQPDEDAKVDEALDESFPASDPPYFSGGKPGV